MQKDVRQENVVAQGKAIQKSAIENIASQKVVNNGRSTMKTNGNGTV